MNKRIEKKLSKKCSDSAWIDYSPYDDCVSYRTTRKINRAEHEMEIDEDRFMCYRCFVVSPYNRYERKRWRTIEKYRQYVIRHNGVTTVVPLEF